MLLLYRVYIFLMYINRRLEKLPLNSLPYSSPPSLTSPAYLTDPPSLRSPLPSLSHTHLSVTQQVFAPHIQVRYEAISMLQ